jgi:phosphoribosylglycinamide formyltransferase 2
MSIGTPLSPVRHRVMLLGSGELGKEVIIALQRLGVERSQWIAMRTPRHQVAHRTHVDGHDRPGALRALIEQERPHIIVPELEAIATEVLVELEDASARRSSRRRAPRSSP